MLHIERFVCNPFQENTYIVSDETNEAVIIDCGAFYEEERRAVVDYIRDHHLVLKRLLATHGHIDHNYGNNTIYDEIGICPEISAADNYLMQQLKEQSEAFIGQPLNYQMPPIGHYLMENETVEWGAHAFTVIPTPGHTPGGVFFYCKEESIAFSGDTLFRMSVGRTDFEQGSFADLTASLQRIITLLPPETRILCGHGPHTTIAAELKDNPYLRR